MNRDKRKVKKYVSATCTEMLSKYLPRENDSAVFSLSAYNLGILKGEATIDFNCEIAGDHRAIKYMFCRMMCESESLYELFKEAIFSYEKICEAERVVNLSS
jgi:hypothetical protein